ncbi:MAG: response regulator [Woeseiaceae bacterium]|nr:response regulator [Woeseiaceae bacterium]
MNDRVDENSIRILIADDDEHILACYREAFSKSESTDYMKALDLLSAELFDPAMDIVDEPHFEVVACSQGDDAIKCATEAARNGQPFDVVILDVRMPPGIDGVEAGSQIRKLDPNIEIVFVTGFSDVPREELERRVPPPMKLHYFNKPISFMRLAEDVVQMVRSH